MKHRVVAGLVGWVGAWLVGGSLGAAPLDGFTLVAESTHFTHFARGRAKTDAKRREGHLARIEKDLGVRLGRRVAYYAYEAPEELYAVTGKHAAGYFFPSLDQLHATPEAEAHEIVHLVSHELGDPGPFFNEGLAVALGNGDRLGGWPVDRVARQVLRRIAPESLEAQFASLQTSWEAVATAGSFVRWLNKRHGTAKVAAFFRSCGRTGQPAGFETAFGSALPDELRAWARSLGVDPPAVRPDAQLARAQTPEALGQPVAQLQ